MIVVNGYVIQPNANLCQTNLCQTNLRGADLRGADLCGADLCRADLRGADLPPTLITPAGELIVYKKATTGIVTLKIPAEARRHNATGRKCRAEYAYVVDAPAGACSLHDHTFRYITGQEVRPTERSPYDPDRWNECSGGIHFFLTREEAEEYS